MNIMEISSHFLVRSKCPDLVYLLVMNKKDNIKEYAGGLNGNDPHRLIGDDII